MVRNSPAWLLFLVLLPLMPGCRSKQTSSVPADKIIVARDSSVPQVKYARGFRFEHLDGSLILIFSDPLNPGREITRYRLVERGKQVARASGYTDIQIPVSHIAASSTTHAGFLSAIKAGASLMGCNNPERLYDSLLYSRFESGALVRTGRDQGYNLEYLISSKPDLVLKSGVDGQFVPDPRLVEAGIPVMYILEWMEPTPLGRAEWVKVFGKVTGKSQAADSVFNLVEAEYLKLAELGRGATKKVQVLTGNVFKGTWYMPGGRNYMARFFEDAGMDYLWKDNDQAASLALSFEAVVYRLADAPVWINVNVDSLSALIAAEQRYNRFRAFQEKRVYSVSNRINKKGGNDFWESAVIRPDLLLADLLAIAHPEILPAHKWNYYKPLDDN